MQTGTIIMLLFIVVVMYGGAGLLIAYALRHKSPSSDGPES
jgi:hypothetical protein